MFFALKFVWLWWAYNFEFESIHKIPVLIFPKSNKTIFSYWSLGVCSVYDCDISLIIISKRKKIILCYISDEDTSAKFWFISSPKGIQSEVWFDGIGSRKAPRLYPIPTFFLKVPYLLVSGKNSNMTFSPLYFSRISLSTLPVYSPKYWFCYLFYFHFDPLWLVHLQIIKSNTIYQYLEN